jgi:hypothetical protein
MHGQNWPPKQNMNFLKLKNKKLQKRRKRRRKKERNKGQKTRKKETHQSFFFFFFFERKRIKVAVIQIVINLQHTEFRGWPKKKIANESNWNTSLLRSPQLVYYSCMQVLATVKENTTTTSKVHKLHFKHA